MMMLTEVVAPARGYLMSAKQYFEEVAAIAALVDTDAIENMAAALLRLRQRNGRIFFLGVGGSAGNCSHAVNDFRKLCGIECYSPVDNVSELTARTNDEGWDTVFIEYLKVSRANKNDAIFVLSVGGGDRIKQVSTNIISAVDFAKLKQLDVFGIVGRKSGHTANVGSHVIVVPEVNSERVTPHSEAFQAVIWHCLVSHPNLQINQTKW